MIGSSASSFYATVPTAASVVLPVIAPGSGQQVDEVRSSTAAEVEQTVAAARAAFETWSRTTWRHRRHWLKSWSQRLTDQADVWIEDLIRLHGKPRVEAIGEVLTTLEAIRWTIDHGKSVLKPRRIPPGRQRLMNIPTAEIVPNPLGVIGVWGTWNFPLYLNAPVIAQALAAGNAVVFKPSELAAATGRRLAESWEGLDHPAGLLGLIQGDAEVGRRLAEQSLDKGVFTGGIVGGRAVLTALAARGIPAVAELSGYDPALILPDADREFTLPALVWGAFVNAGQTCIGIKRILVVGTQTDARQWCVALATAAARLRVGDPAGSQGGAVDVGPLISNSARQRFAGFLAAAREHGAIVHQGGRVLEERAGWFVAPTVLEAGPDPDAVEQALAGCFGPLVLVRSHPTCEAAIDAINRGDYGLGASVWGRDLKAARLVAQRLRVGMVTINDVIAPTAHAGAPFGGVRASGYGRTHGADGLREFVHQKTLYVRPARGWRPQVYPYHDRLTRLLRGLLRILHH